MTDTQIDILKTATDWAKAEMFSSGFFVLFGLAFCLSSYCFWQFGKTDTAKAYVIPLLVAGSPCNALPRKGRRKTCRRAHNLSRLSH